MYGSRYYYVYVYVVTIEGKKTWYPKKSASKGRSITHTSKLRSIVGCQMTRWAATEQP